jgi:hypothetical protein
MSTPIYQIYVVKNNTAMWQAYNGLPEEERKALDEKQLASLDALGAKNIVSCFSAWADEEHPYWGIIRFPSLEARIQHTTFLQKIGWLQGADAFTLLGTSESEPLEVKIPNPIYKLWINKANPAGAIRMSELSQEEMAAILEKHNAIYKENGSIIMLDCTSYWCNEAYISFGISVYPSIEANMKVMQGLEALGWRQAVDSFTLLGIPYTDIV